MTPDASRIPRVTLSKGTRLERVYPAFDAEGQPRSPWFFSARGIGAEGRFDLAPPKGTCYLAGDLDAAFAETFRGALLIAHEDVERRRALVATAMLKSEPWADLTSERATEAGVTLDLFGGSDYSASQAIADQCFESGDRGVVSLIRHQSHGTARGYSLFGEAGPCDHPPEGWTVQTIGLRDCLDGLAPHLRARVRAVPRAMRPTNP